MWFGNLVQNNNSCEDSFKGPEQFEKFENIFHDTWAEIGFNNNSPVIDL